MLSLAAIQFSENRSKLPLDTAESSEVEQDNNADFNKNEGLPSAQSVDSIFPANLRSSYEIALAEVVSDEMDTHLWAEAYAHTDTDDAAKRRYVRERAREINSQGNGFSEDTPAVNASNRVLGDPSKPKLRNLGWLGWLMIIAFYTALWLMQLGELSFIQEMNKIPWLITDLNSVFFYSFILISIRILLFILLQRTISGHQFFKWPMEEIRRPRSFLAIWIGLFSSFLVSSAVLLSIYLIEPTVEIERDRVEMSIINVSKFLAYLMLGFVLAFLYKIKVRKR